jgi:hypothetical protein
MSDPVNRSNTKNTDSTKLTDLEKQFVHAYIASIDNFKDIDEDGTKLDAGVWALREAGYSFTGEAKDKNERRMVRRLLKKPDIQKYLNELIQSRENELVFDKLWVLREMKSLYKVTTSDNVKKGLLDSMAKIGGLFQDANPAGGEAGDAAAIARAAYDMRLKKNEESKMLPFKTGESDQV